MTGGFIPNLDIAVFCEDVHALLLSFEQWRSGHILRAPILVSMFNLINSYPDRLVKREFLSERVMFQNPVEDLPSQED